MNPPQPPPTSCLLSRAGVVVRKTIHPKPTFPHSACGGRPSQYRDVVRRKRLAKRLVSLGEAIMVGRGAECFLATVLGDNLASMTLVESIGYRRRFSVMTYTWPCTVDKPPPPLPAGRALTVSRLSPTEAAMVLTEAFGERELFPSRASRDALLNAVGCGVYVARLGGEGEGGALAVAGLLDSSQAMKLVALKVRHFDCSCTSLWL
jgi:hypothetical protein